MAARSTITSLPEEVAAQFDDQVRAGRLSIDQLTAWLQEAGHPRSRSAVGRYVKKINEQLAELRRTREVTKIMVNSLGEAGVEGEQGRVLGELVGNLTFTALRSMQVSGEDPDPKAVVQLARAVRDLGAANQLHLEHQVRAKTLRDAAKVATEAAGRAGLSKATRTRIEQEILGLSR